MIYLYLSMIESEQGKDKFIQIYEKYKNLMYTIAFNILKNHHIAEEAVQDALFKLVKYIDDIGTVDSKQTRNYIAMVTRSIAFDIYKKEKNLVKGLMKTQSI